jgi:mannose-6-phosphate isomerase
MMDAPAIEDAAPELRDRAAWWRAWLFDRALPFWAERGLNPAGGFFDRLDERGRSLVEPMRLRVQARQVYAFAEAGKLGWSGDWRRVTEHGLEFLLTQASLPDGRVAHRFAPDGSVLDAAPDLYDQAFALLAYAAAYRALRDERAKAAAHRLLEALLPHRHPSGGFRELDGSGELRANPQMHLLEAVQAWAELDRRPEWSGLAAELADLCGERLTTPEGALREFFTDDWRPAPGDRGEHTEPGHHFEWAWLLARQGGARGELIRRLCERGEAVGVDPVRGVAMNAVHISGRPTDPAARLWPQTERLKAALVLRRDPRWTSAACEAADAMRLYVTDEGLWLDVMGPDGVVQEEPAPASSFYHIVCALSELMKAAVRTA